MKIYIGLSQINVQMLYKSDYYWLNLRLDKVCEAEIRLHFNHRMQPLNKTMTPDHSTIELSTSCVTSDLEKWEAIVYRHLLQ